MAPSLEDDWGNGRPGMEHERGKQVNKHNVLRVWHSGIPSAVCRIRMPYAVCCEEAPTLVPNQAQVNLGYRRTGTCGLHGQSV